MKTTKAFLFLFFILQCTCCYSQGKDGGLLAAPYPGSIVETFPGTTDASWRALMDARSRTYYSKDPMEKVKEHYTKLLGPFEEAWANYNYTRHVVPFSDVYDIVTKRGGSIGEGGESFYGGTMAGVTLFGVVLSKVETYVPVNGIVNKVLEDIKGTYVQRFQEVDGVDGIDPAKMLKRMEDPELKQTEARYEHMKWAYFLETKEKRKDNLPGNMSIAEVIYDKYFVAPAEARMKELADVQKKYADAMAKMKYDEAGKLGDRMVKLSGMQSNPKEDWDTAIKCLEELAKNAYATKIVIDMHPSKWDLTPPK